MLEPPVGSPRDHPVPLLRSKNKELAVFVCRAFPRGRAAAVWHCVSLSPSPRKKKINTPLQERVFRWIKRFTEFHPALPFRSSLRCVACDWSSSGKHHQLWPDRI